MRFCCKFEFVNGFNMAHHHYTKLDWYKPGLGESWIIALTMLLSGLVFGLFIGLMKTISPSAANVWDAQSLSYILTFLFPAVFIAVRANSAKTSAIMNGTDPIAVNHPSFGKAGGFGAFALAALGMLALSVVIEPLTAILPMPDSIKALFESVFVNTKLWDAILATCILAPILEELLCRGIMLRGMLTRISPWKAIFWSALIFAVIHLNPWQSIPAFIIGFFFGWLYYRTGYLWLTIFLHCLNNSLSTALTRLFPDIEIDQGLIDILPHGTYIIVYAACAVVLAMVIILLHRLLPKKANE